MGLFSGSTKKIRSSSSVLFYSDEPEIIKEAILRSIFKQTPIANSITLALMSSAGQNVRKYFNYAENHYTYGLPSTSIAFYEVDEVAVKAAIEEEIGSTITIHSAMLAAPDLMEECEDILASFNYSYSSNTLWINGEEVMLSGIDFGDSSGTVDITYIQEIATPVYNYGSNGSIYGTTYTYSYVEKTLTKYIGIDPDSLNYVVYYSLGALTEEELNAIEVSDYLYWKYTAGSGSHPLLDSFEESELDNTFMPIVALRRGKTWWINPSNKDANYTTTKKLLYRFGIDIKGLYEALKDTDDIDKMDSIYLYHGVPINTTDSNLINYLYEFLENLYAASKYKKTAYTSFLERVDNGYKGSPKLNKLTISANGFKNMLAYLYVDKTVVSGSIGEVGECTKAIHVRPTRQTTTKRRGGDGEEETVVSAEWETSDVTVTKQISPSTYVRYTWYGVKHLNAVHAGSLSDSVMSGRDVIITTLDDLSSGNFVIPMSYEFLMRFNLNERNDILFKTARLLINVSYSKKLKWYQSGFFKFVMVAVSVAAMAYGLYTVGANLAVAASAGAIAVLSTILITAVEAVTINYAAKLVLEQLPDEWAMILTLALAATSFASPGTTLASGSVAGTPWAVDIAMISGGFTQALQEVQTDQIQDIQNQISALQKQQEEAEEAAKEEGFNWELSDPLDTFNISSAWETPEIKLSTLDLPELTLATLDAVSYYNDSTLNLDRRIV